MSKCDKEKQKIIYICKNEKKYIYFISINILKDFSITCIIVIYLFSFFRNKVWDIHLITDLDLRGKKVIASDACHENYTHTKND